MPEECPVQHVSHSNFIHHTFVALRMQPVIGRYEHKQVHSQNIKEEEGHLGDDENNLLH